MKSKLNIHSKGESIYLYVGKYEVYILGGFGVVLNSFRMTLRYKKTGEVFECERVRLATQVFISGVRAKRIFKLELSKEGEYEVIFAKSEELVVRKRNLFFDWFFIFNNRVICNEDLEIVIYTDKLTDYKKT